MSCKRRRVWIKRGWIRNVRKLGKLLILSYNKTKLTTKTCNHINPDYFKAIALTNNELSGSTTFLEIFFARVPWLLDNIAPFWCFCHTRAQLGTQVDLSSCKSSTCELGHEVVWLCSGDQPPTHPTTHPVLSYSSTVRCLNRVSEPNLTDLTYLN